MTSRDESLNINLVGLVGLACVAAVVDIVGHIAVDRLAGIVAIGEGDRAQTVTQRLLWQVACEHSGAVAQRKRCFGIACLARHIGDINSHVE